MAVGHTILMIVCYLLKRETTYAELAGHYFDAQDRQGVKRRAIPRLEDLGYQVTLQPKAAA